MALAEAFFKHTGQLGSHILYYRPQRGMKLSTRKLRAFRVHVDPEIALRGGHIFAARAAAVIDAVRSAAVSL